MAQNVLNGQRNRPRHFGWYGHGSSLTRANNMVVRDRNRRAACGRTNFHRPWSCDEYPFADTYQGAYYYPHDYSIKKVLGSQNSAEGRARLTMYKTERLLTKDPYWVIVEP